MLIDTNGPIKCFNLSQKWFGEELYSEDSRRTFIELYHVSNLAVKWSLTCYGRRGGAGFAKEQEKSFFSSELGLSGQECFPLLIRFGPSPSSVGVDDVRLERGEINGRRAVVWHQSNIEEKLKAVHYMVDVFDDASIFVDVTYAAPFDDFDKYVNDAQELTSSIVWAAESENTEWREDAGSFGMFLNGRHIKGRQIHSGPISYEQWLSKHPELASAYQQA